MKNSLFLPAFMSLSAMALPITAASAQSPFSYEQSKSCLIDTFVFWAVADGMDDPKGAEYDKMGERWGEYTDATYSGKGAAYDSIKDEVAEIVQFTIENGTEVLLERHRVGFESCASLLRENGDI